MISNELKIAFVHVTRTGGRSLSAFLAQNLERQHKMNSPHSALNHASVDFLSYHNLIDGHCGYQVVKLPRCFKYITIFRNPLERVISSYGRMMGPNTMDIAVRMRKEKWSFVDFVTSENAEAQYWVNNATFLLSGITVDSGDVDINELLVTALANLRYNFDFVGIYEYMDETIEILKLKYDLKGDMPYVGKNEKNETGYTPTKEEIAITNRELFPDWILYRVGAKLFNEQYHKLMNG